MLCFSPFFFFFLLYLFILRSKTKLGAVVEVILLLAIIVHWMVMYFERRMYIEKRKEMIICLGLYTKKCSKNGFSFHLSPLESISLIYKFRMTIYASLHSEAKLQTNKKIHFSYFSVCDPSERTIKKIHFVFVLWFCCCCLPEERK